MRGAAVSDLHLGFRQFSATRDGRNAREVDVEEAWRRAVEIVVEHGPDLVTVAGDVFHHPRVGSHAVKAWRDGVRRIVTETDARLVVVQGNHDAGRTAEVLSPIVIPDDLRGVHVAITPKRLRLRVAGGEDVSVACFPFVTLADAEVYDLSPDAQADVNVLLVHAAVRTTADGADGVPTFYGGSGALDVGREAERWDVIACGDFHDFRRLHADRLAFYSGAIERTTTNIWAETAGKGVVLYDSGAGEMRFREIRTRPVIDLELPPADPERPSAAAVNHALASFLEAGTGRDAVVRLRVDAFPRGDRDRIDWALVRRLKEHCLHFQLDLRFAADAGPAARLGLDRGGRTLLEEAADFFEDDGQDVRDCALSYLAGAP